MLELTTAPLTFNCPFTVVVFESVELYTTDGENNLIISTGSNFSQEFNFDQNGNLFVPQLIFTNSSQVVTLQDYVTNLGFPGTTILPNGMILQYGHGTTNGNQILFLNTFPHECTIVISTPWNSSGSSCSVDNWTQQGFNATSSNGPISIVFLAIGS